MSNPGAASTVTTTFVGGGNPFYVADDPADVVGFYGTTPVAQRASSNQASTNIAVSASFGATQLAVVQEIMNTLTALGIWKGSA